MAVDRENRFLMVGFLLSAACVHQALLGAALRGDEPSYGATPRYVLQHHCAHRFWRDTEEGGQGDANFLVSPIDAT